MSATGVSARKVLPKRLEEDLENVPKYKARLPAPKVRTVAELMTDSAERAMFDEVFGSVRPPSSGSKIDNLLAQMNQSKLTSSNGNMINLSNIQQGNVSSNSDFDMTGSNPSSSSSSTFESSLLSRVLLVEEEAKRLRQQLAVANKEVSSLTAENDLLKKLSHDQTYMIHRSNELQSENKDLRKQIVEMEQFLDDYGLVWVGNGSSGVEVGPIGAADTKYESKEADRDGDKNGSKDNHGDKSPSSGSSSGSADKDKGKEEMTVSYKTFKRQIDQLNALLDEEGTRIVATDNKAKLLHPQEYLDKIRVAFHRDGLMINRGPFRYASSPLCAAFVRDIVDGFFPSEFRPEHPDGIYIELIDLHTDYFNPKSEPKMSKEALLNNLPKTVIKNGQLINMRESVGELLSSKAPVVVSALIDNEEAGITDAEPPCKISVKWSEGNKQGIITVSKFGTVMQLRAKIKSMFYTNSADSEATSALVSSDSKEKEVTIELRTTFPSQILEDGTTLEAAGLWPKGQVHARLIR